MAYDAKDHGGIIFGVEHIGEWSTKPSQSIKDKTPFVFTEGYSKKSGKTSIIKFGSKNDHPKYLKELVGKSGLHKTLIETKATLAMGDDIIFVPEDDADPEDGKKAYDALKELGLIDMREGISMDIATYGGFAVQNVYQDDLSLSHKGTRKPVMYYKHDFDEFRLMKPVKNKYGIYEPEYGSFHHHWGNSYKPKDMLTLPIWFPEVDKNGELTDKEVNFQLDTELIGADDDKVVEYENRFIYYGKVYTNTAKFYPVPDYQTSATLDAITLDGELINFDVNEVRNGLSIGYVITFYRKNWSEEDPEKEERLREAEKKIVSGSMTGAQNKGKVTILRAQPPSDGEKNNGGLNIQPVPNNNNSERHNVLEKRKNVYILVGHGIIAPEIGGVPDLANGGFSSEADKIVDAISNLFFTRLNKWRRTMEKFYVAMAREAGFKIKALKFVDKIPFRKKISDNILVHSYTIDEIREMNGNEPLTEEQEVILFGEKNNVAPTTGTQTALKLD